MIIGKNNEKYYKVALHQHTTISDGKMSPEEMVALYKSRGYDAVAFTDHWKYHATDNIDGMLILAGCEYDTGVRETIEGVMHIVGIGMKKQPKLTRENTRQEIIDKINELGGVAVLAHPCWSLNSVEDAEALDGFLACEIYNACSEAHESMRAYSDHFIDVSANRGRYYTIFATDDAHFYDGTDETRGFVYVKADELSERAIVDALKNGDCFASQGPELFVTREGNTLKIDCSPCAVVSVMSNLSIQMGRTLRGDNITHFEYELEDIERWARVQVRDKDGNFAWSNIFVK